MSQIRILSRETGFIGEEIVLMEFQGDFEHSEIARFDSLALGDLKEVSKGNYELQIGNHLLKGKMQELAKPIIMTEKVESEGQIQLEVRAVIKRKLLFATRPTPLR